MTFGTARDLSSQVVAFPMSSFGILWPFRIPDFFLAALPAVCQAVGGSISGTVIDPSQGVDQGGSPLLHNRLATICASGLMLPVLHGQLMYVK
jgi:hypothetical protein